MPTTYPMPIQEAIRDVISDLLGKGVAVDKTSPLELEENDFAVVSHLISDDGRLAAVLVADLALVANLGAALTLVPVIVAQESVKKNRLEEEMLLENYGEIVNVMSRLFNTASTPHVRYVSTIMIAEISPEIAALRESYAARRTFAIKVEGYGEGRLEISVG